MNNTLLLRMIPAQDYILLQWKHVISTSCSPCKANTTDSCRSSGRCSQDSTLGSVDDTELMMTALLRLLAPCMAPSTPCSILVQASGLCTMWLTSTGDGSGEWQWLYCCSSPCNPLDTLLDRPLCRRESVSRREDVPPFL